MAVHGSAASFGAALVRFTQDLTPAQAAAVHGEVTLIALTRIVDRTPVDTGRARNNWQTTIGAAAEGVIEAVDKDGAAAKERCIAALVGLPPFAVSYITNNLPYAEPLEDGHSQRQAPNGMVHVTLVELQTGLDKAAA